MGRRVNGAAHAPDDRQLRFLHLQPRAVPRRARRRGARSCATTRSTSTRSTRSAAERIVISPGPVHAERGRHLARADQARSPDAIPILGVCLGHQAIGQAFGGKVVRAPTLMHGKTSRDPPRRQRRVRRAAEPVQRDALPLARGRARVAARRARGHRLDRGRRDHGPAPRSSRWRACSSIPESILTEHGHALLRNFLDAAQGR